jgi:hypothetical protein
VQQAGAATSWSRQQGSAWPGTQLRSRKRQQRAPPGAQARPRPTWTSAAVTGLGTGIGRRGGRGEPQGYRAASMAVCSGKRALLHSSKLQRSPFDLACLQQVPLALAALHPKLLSRRQGSTSTPSGSSSSSSLLRSTPLTPAHPKHTTDSRPAETPFPLPLSDCS